MIALLCIARYQSVEQGAHAGDSKKEVIALNCGSIDDIFDFGLIAFLYVFDVHLIVMTMWLVWGIVCAHVLVNDD